MLQQLSHQLGQHPPCLDPCFEEQAPLTGSEGPSQHLLESLTEGSKVTAGILEASSHGRVLSVKWLGRVSRRKGGCCFGQIAIPPTE
jgi:hypothetical protein